MLGDIPDEPSTGPILRQKQGLEFHLHSLDTVEVVFKLEEKLCLESITTADVSY